MAKTALELNIEKVKAGKKLSVTGRNMLERAGYDPNTGELRNAPASQTGEDFSIAAARNLAEAQNARRMQEPVPATQAGEDFSIAAARNLVEAQNARRAQPVEPTPEISPAALADARMGNDGNLQQYHLRVTGGYFTGTPEQLIAKVKSLEANTGIPAPTFPTEFNTGDPARDDMLNNVLIPAVEDVVGDNLDAIFDPETFEQIAARIGPGFDLELQELRDQFNLDREQLQAERGLFERQYGTDQAPGTELSRGLEDIGRQRERMLEDETTQRKMIARNYQEALADSQAALQSRNLLYGGTRKKEEARLGELQKEQLGSVERATQRSLEDLGTQQGRLESDIPFQRQFGAGELQRQLGGLESRQTLGERDVEFRKLGEVERERAAQRQLSSDLLRTPQFIPQ